MRSGTDPVFHPKTGIDPVDQMWYRLQPSLNAKRDLNTGIILVTIDSYGQDGSAAVGFHNSDIDLIAVARGTEIPVHGKLAGTKFSYPGSPNVRTSFMPHGADFEASFGARSCSKNLLIARRYFYDQVAELNAKILAPALFSEDQRLARLATMLADEVNEPSFAGHILVDGLTRSIAATLAKINVPKIHEKSDRIWLPPHKLRQIYDYVDTHLGEQLSLADMAATAGLSPFHFSRVFVRATGVSPYRYLINRRINLAKQLLAADNMTIAEIGKACGFPNPAHFATAFARVVGLTPSSFRHGQRSIKQ